MNTTTTSTTTSASATTASPGVQQTTGFISSCDHHHHQQQQQLPLPPIHIQVQQLNSQGAYYMNQGQYDIAIDALIRALKLWETIDESEFEFDIDIDDDSAADSATAPPHCGCSIDDCILQQQQQQQQSSSNNELIPLYYHHHHKQDASHQSIQTPVNSDTTTTTCSQSSSSSSYHTSNDSSSSCMELDEDESSSSSQQQQQQERRFIYSRPILTTSQFWRTDRIVPKENTVSLILILNLAMAHHLSAIHQNQTQGQGQQRNLLQKALQLYELAHQLQLDELTCSPMATMIIANNVGEIHLSVLNETKHHMCMNHLLSTMMYLIDNGQVPSSPSSSSSSGDGDVVVVNNKNNYFWDGFLKNVSSILILKQNCAPVA